MVSVVNVSSKIKFIGKARFMESSLSNLVDNLTEGIHKIKWKNAIVFLNIKVLRMI